MCGIAGYVGTHQPDLLEPMCDTMAHRGPDDSGVGFDAESEVGFGHRRLAIIDLSAAGHQPMHNHDRSLWITYNGEIYNYLEHRERLQAKGHVFRGESDTEVLLAMYEEMGLDCLNELNGIFAFAIWDEREKKLVLARDHAGVKPLYYRVEGRALYFASEMKALLRIPGLERSLRLPSLGDYLTFLWVPGEHTMFEGIDKVEPGQVIVWKDGKLDIRRWFHLDYEPDDSLSEGEWIEQVHDTFLRTTQRQMVSDVPLGAFLSGGLDSSSIVACMRRTFPGRTIQTYSVRFEGGEIAREQGVDDYPYAKRVALELGVRFKSVKLDPKVIEMLPKMVYHLDEPDADPAIFPSYLISRLAREDGMRVLLSGTGGDEVFFGYRSHLAYSQYDRFSPIAHLAIGPVVSAALALGTPLLGAQNLLFRRMAKFRRGLNTSGLDRHLELSDWSSAAIRRQLFSPAVASQLGDGVPQCMVRYANEFEGRGEINLHSHLLIQSFLAAHNFLYTDKSSMATSIEARVPFMDVELMRLCARIPEHFKLHGRVTKYVLKQAMSRYLPADLIHRKKTGFGAPLRRWVQSDLKPIIAELLGHERVKSRGLFEPAFVKRLLKENESGAIDHTYLIYALLNLEIWQQTFIDRPGEEVTF
jgi:asparagine synthase (glutamine-hydrolysing)